MLKGEYLATSASGTYTSIPTSYEIHICLTTQGHLCGVNTAINPVGRIEWCIYVFVMNYQNLINRHYLVDFTRHANLVLYLD